MKPRLSIAILVFAASVAAAAAGAVPKTPAAETAPPPTFTLPHAYDGYSQPEITDCANSGSLRTQCTVPAMTAGLYLVIAVANATATGEGATQSLAIGLNGQACVSITPTAFTGKKGLRAACKVSFLTDQPLTVSAVYKVQNATPDPAGPKLAFRRAQWSGVVEAQPVVLQTPSPAAKPAGKPGPKAPPSGQ